MAVSLLSPDLPSITHITAISKFLPGDPIENDRLEDYLGMVGDRTTQVLALVAIALGKSSKGWKQSHHLSIVMTAIAQVAIWRGRSPFQRILAWCGLAGRSPPD